jgi:HEAT repeat protein
VDAADPEGPVARAAALAALGHRPPLPPGAAARLSRAAVDDPDARVRAAALGALSRAGTPARAARAWADATLDRDAAVRRRAAELAPGLAGRGAPVSPEQLVALLGDDDLTVLEAAAWALGELAARGAVPALAAVTTGHRDALAREAAVAALGAIGDPAGLEAVLGACRDVATVRRRAVPALAGFDGPAVDAALERAERDRDWQVRQAAEDLLEAAPRQ